MSEIGEAVGTAVEGGLFARVVGGGRGNGPKGDVPLDQGHFAEETCLNCGNALVGSHCHACGQKAHLHRTIGAFLHDLLHGALHFDGKTWRTLPKLAFKPGELTRRYIEGERARYVSPMALFLFSVFLMFAVFQLAGISAPTDMDSGTVNNAITETREKALADLADAAQRQQRFEEGTADYDQAVSDRRNAEEAIKGLDRARVFDFESNPDMRLTGVAWLDEGLVKKWGTNPGLMLYKLQTNFYKFSWLLIPLSVPFVWLTFAWVRRFRAYDHAIFVTYSLSFMTLAILALTLLGLAGLHAAIIALASTFIPPIHIYKHLRGTYELSRWSAFWRLAILSIFILVILTLFLQVLLILGLF